LTVDTNTLFVDAANNRVGVGTVSPAVAFGVAGNSVISGASPFISLAYNQAGATPNYWQLGADGVATLFNAGTGSNGAWKFDIGGGSEAMRITSTGSVGIGTSSPASGYGLDVAGAMRLGEGANLSWGNTYADNGPTVAGSSAGGFLAFYPNGAASGERMRITSAGLVGIGTSLPGNPLTLVYGGGAVGAQIIGNASYAQMQVTAAGADTNSYFTFGANGTGKGIIQRNSTDVITIDASNNVGIGASSPAYKLDVAGVIRSNTGIKSITASGGQPEFVLDQSGVASWTIYNPPSNTALRFYNGVDRMTITSTGSVGIGTSSPAAKLDVLVGGDERLLFGTLGVGNAIYSVDGPNAAYKVLHLVASDIVFRPNGTEHMRITSTGSVGIGTSSPAQPNGSGLVIYDATLPRLTLRNSTTGTASTDGGGLLMSGANLFVTNRENGNLIFEAANATEHMRIDASGNLLVGTTSSSAARMDIVSGVNQNTVAMVCPSFNYNVGVFHNQGTSGNNAFVAFGTEASFTFRGSISYNRAGGLTAYNTTSDYRAKDIAGPISDASDAVLSLKPYMGTMKGATVERPMFVAHETQEIAPYAVTGEKDAVDGDGNPKYQQMDHSALVPLLTAALQEALTEIADLKARVAALEA
jgi:hypothetical protein